MPQLIAGIIAAVVAVASSVTGFVVTAKNVAKEKIDAIMQQQVYNLGLSYEAVKQTNIKLYRNNKKKFDERYNYWANKRNADMLNGTHKQQQTITQNKTMSIILIIIIAVMVFMIIYSLKKK